MALDPNLLKNALAYSYGPRQPATVMPGASSTFTPIYHTYSPGNTKDPNPWKLKPGETLHFADKFGYYGMPGGAVAAKTGGATGQGVTIDSLIKQIYGTIETPAQQEARINREVDAQMKAQQKMVEDMYARQRADALATMQAQSLAGQAAAAMSKDLISGVGGEYNAAAKEISGLAHGLSGSVGATTKGDISAANAALAPGNLAVEAGAEHGSLAPGGALQAGVEDYRGGTLAAQMFGTQGEAASFGLAGLTGAQGLRATQEAEAELHTTLNDLRGKESDAINALASGRLDLYHQYKNEAADARVKSLTLVQGLIAQKQANSQAMAKLAQQYARDAAIQKDRTIKNTIAAHREDRETATAKVNAKATQVRLNQAQQRIADSRTVNEARIAIAQGNLKVAQAKEMRAAVKAMQESGLVDVNTSKARGVLYGKDGKPILDANKQTIPSTLLTATTKKGMTAGQMANQMEQAQNLIPQWFYGTKPAGKPGSRAVSADQSPGFDASDITTWGTNRVSYVEAQKRLNRMKIPRKQALNMLAEFWHRGQGGRPWLNLEERHAAVKQFGSHRVDSILLKANAILKADQSEAGYKRASDLIAALLSGGPLPVGV